MPFPPRRLLGVPRQKSLLSSEHGENPVCSSIPTLPYAVFVCLPILHPTPISHNLGYMVHSIILSHLEPSKVLQGINCSINVSTSQDICEDVVEIVHVKMHLKQEKDIGM